MYLKRHYIYYEEEIMPYMQNNDINSNWAVCVFGDKLLLKVNLNNYSACPASDKLKALSDIFSCTRSGTSGSSLVLSFELFSSKFLSQECTFSWATMLPDSTGYETLDHYF